MQSANIYEWSRKRLPLQCDWGYRCKGADVAFTNGNFVLAIFELDILRLR